MRRLSIGACVMAATLMLGGCATPDTAPEAISAPLASTTGGDLRGVREGDLSVFRGIPYAAPPVGDLRWAAPQPAASREGLRDASTFGPGCIQPPVPATSLYNDPPSSTSEDCLTLNVWAPHDVEDAPVIVWIHGGSLRIGASGLPMYDGSEYARRGVVFVSINYRLGLLGWMAHPELSQESADGISGNYGLLDQIAALRWVRDNIAAFGGNPDNVTVMGESAGALSTTYLMVSPPARDLFDKAIIQSTNLRTFPELDEPVYGMPSAERIGIDMVAKLGAGDIAGARAMDPQELTNRSTMAGFNPQGTIDGATLPRQLIDTFDSGEQARVPVIVGYNAHEYRPVGAPGIIMPPDADGYAARIGAIYGDLAPEFLRIYPHAEGNNALLDATSDGIFGWSGERIAKSQQALGLGAYFYVFDHCYPSARARDLCAFHASELPFTFGNLDGEDLPDVWPVPDGPHDRAVSKAMLDYWTSFAADGVPRAGGLPDWRSYGAQQNYMMFEDAPVAGRDFKPGMVELHEAFGRQQREAGEAWGMLVGLAAETAKDKE
ncbi:carboxylesterase/lipase family protein [Citromicrobium bathyomarinum]|uniref:carboxylesterase/lipase family protein n=1 Tax=Citromicrobium bathyomarinum TaxID=72174 RepID=UPI0031599A53